MSKEYLPYIPILKLQGAECTALGELKTLLPKINPLIQIIPKSQDKINIADISFLDYSLSLILSYAAVTKVYVDFSMICGNNLNESLACIESKKRLIDECNIVPVLYTKDILSSELSSHSLTFLNDRGVCIRINYDEFMKKNWWKNFNDSLLLKLRDKDKLTIIIDFKNVKEEDYDSIIPLLKDSEVTSDWKSFYIAAGSFPETFKGMIEGYSTVERSDYLFWKDNLACITNIGYADYTVQSPHFKVLKYNPNARVSASYTGDEVYHIYKGHPKKSKLVKEEGAMKQYFAHAINFAHSDYFKGHGYSYGDEYIQEKANQYENGKETNPGNAVGWRAASINHHIIHTINQIDSIYNDK